MLKVCCILKFQLWYLVEVLTYSDSSCLKYKKVDAIDIENSRQHFSTPTLFYMNNVKQLRLLSFMALFYVKEEQVMHNEYTVLTEWTHYFLCFKLWKVHGHYILIFWCLSCSSSSYQNEYLHSNRSLVS